MNADPYVLYILIIFPTKKIFIHKKLFQKIVKFVKCGNIFKKIINEIIIAKNLKIHKYFYCFFTNYLFLQNIYFFQHY